MTEAERALLLEVAGWIARLEEDSADVLRKKTSRMAETLRRLIAKVAREVAE